MLPAKHNNKILASSSMPSETMGGNRCPKGTLCDNCEIPVFMLNTSYVSIVSLTRIKLRPNILGS